MFILQGLHVTQAQISAQIVRTIRTWYLWSTSLSLFQYKIVNKYNKCDRKNTLEEFFHVYYLCSSHKNLLEPRRGKWPTFEATGVRGNPEFYSRLGQPTRDTLYLNVPGSQASANFIRHPGVYNASLMKFKMKYSSHQAVNYPLWGPLRICLENVRSLKAFKITH